jgi:serine/threonine protein kinase
MKEDEILYNSKVDSIYIPIYKLGNGTSAEIWFSVELKNFIKNIKLSKIAVDYKALKIFKEFDAHEWFREISILNLFEINGKKSPNISYPETYFTTEDEYNIAVYDVCMCSVYDLYQNNHLTEEALISIIEQMKNSIQFLHDCSFIHTDVKLENFLICGYTKKQLKIIKIVEDYNLKKLFATKIRSNMDTDIILDRLDNQLKQFQNHIYIKLNIEKKKKKEKESDNDSEEEYDDESNYSYETDDEENKLSYDIFHIKEFEEEYEEEEDDDTDKNDEYIIDEKYLINPLIKLTDFGLIKKMKYVGSAYPRINRPPENILGLETTFKSDLWALGFSIYELVNKKTLFKFDHDSIYGDDLYHIKMFFEIFYDDHKDLLELIKKSERKDYFITKNDTLLFTKNIIKRDKNYELYKNLLRIDPDKREL